MSLQDIEQDDGEEFVTRLITPDEYQYHLNQVVSLTTRTLSFLKRKFVSRVGHEVVEYPMQECVSIDCKDERPLLIAAAGVMLVSLICAIFYLLASEWDSLEAGTSVPVGLLFLAAVYGVRWAVGSRRHRIVFEMKSGQVLIWKSRSGDFEYKRGVTQKVVDFAKEAGLLKSGQ